AAWRGGPAPGARRQGGTRPHRRPWRQRLGGDPQPLIWSAAAKSPLWSGLGTVARSTTIPPPPPDPPQSGGFAAALHRVAASRLFAAKSRGPFLDHRFDAFAGVVGLKGRRLLHRLDVEGVVERMFEAAVERALDEANG